MREDGASLFGQANRSRAQWERQSTFRGGGALDCSHGQSLARTAADVRGFVVAVPHTGVDDARIGLQDLSDRDLPMAQGCEQREAGGKNKAIARNIYHFDGPSGSTLAYGNW